jgi:ATP-dependent Clp protease, protease subunit
MRNFLKGRLAFLIGWLVGLPLLLIPLMGASSNADETVVLSSSNLITLSGEVNGDSVGRLGISARSLDSRFTRKPIYLFMNTPGGEIQSGMELLESLKGLNRPVTTVTLFSASMGFQIVQGLGDRYILKNGVLMSHRAYGEFKGNFGGKRPSQMDNRYSLWLTRLQEFDDQVVKRTKGKQTMESYQKAYADELWLTGTQAVRDGYADKIVMVKCDTSLSGTTPHSITFLGLNIVYDLDNCPINTGPMNIRVGLPGDKLSLEYVEEVKERFLQHYALKLRMVAQPSW